MKKAEYDIILTYLKNVRRLTPTIMRTDNDKKYAYIKRCDKCGEDGALTAFSKYLERIAVFYSCEDCHSIYQINNNEPVQIKGIGLYGEKVGAKSLDELFWNV